MIVNKKLYFKVLMKIFILKIINMAILIYISTCIADSGYGAKSTVHDISIILFLQPNLKLVRYEILHF
jgi:hypothetical protein